MEATEPFYLKNQFFSQELDIWVLTLIGTGYY